MVGYGTIPSVDSGLNGSIGTEATPLISNIRKKHELGETWFDKLVFKWFTPILDRGNEKKKLDQDDLDLLPLPTDCMTDDVVMRFDYYWMREVQAGSPSLIRALYQAFGADYIRAGILKLVHDLCVFVGPQVLHAIIVFLRDPAAPLWHGLALTAAVTLSQLTMSLCLRHYFFKCYTTGLRVRTAVVVAVYRKALLLSASERQQRTLGEITNLTSIDAQRLQDLTTYLHALWYSPLQIALALYFLWGQLGASSLGGVAVIIIMIPVTKSIAQWMGGMQRILMKAKDRRVELNSEVLAGMKVIKFQAWEESFQKRISDLREVELTQLLRYFVGSAFSRLLWVFTPLMVALSTFAAYVWSGHQLDVASALTALALFDILRFPLFMLPQIVNTCVEAAVSLNRIRSFLLCEEYKPVGKNNLTTVGVRMENVSAAYDSKKPKPEDGADEKTEKLLATDWEVQLLKSQLMDAEHQIRKLAGREASEMEESSHSSLLCLRRINFECKAGELCAIVGGVGCGKSSFINAILGEVRELAGTTSVNGKLAYFSQTPFIMNATVRDNILFSHVGEEVDEALYQRALDSCALRHDLELLSDGDETEIGEKGVTLSGGQKARVALARAVYHCADITLIDDALSAVDAHVAEHLFEKAIVGELMKPAIPGGKPRSVILVTNAIQYLKHPKVSKIVVLQEGAVAEAGTYKQLSRGKTVFARFLSAIAQSDVASRSGSGVTASPKKGEGERAVIESPEKASKQVARKLMTTESRQTGHVGMQVYLSWCRAAGGVWVPFAIFVVFAVGECLNVLSNWFLTYWSQHGTETNQTTFLAMYAGINLLTAVFGFIRMVMIALLGLQASRRLFADMLAVVLYAPMSFFDTTPVGRLVNRFGKDIYTIDEQLVDTLRMYLMTLFTVFSTIAVISGVNPIFTLCLVPMLLFYTWEQYHFTTTYRELKRLDSANRSPVYALLGESVDGVAVIRSFSAETSLIRRLTSMLDVQQHAYFLTCAAQSWLAVRLELIGTLIIAFAALSAVLEHSTLAGNETYAGLAGLAISYSLSVTQSLNWSVRMASDMEANMVAVERVNEYSQIESEGERRTAVDDGLPAQWPVKGEIQVVNAKLRYRPDLPLVLKGLDILIPGGSKVGVVGRTGAGKSTLMVALLRIVELCEGRILIDGQNIRDVGLAKLRGNIAAIPQDPVLYSGTVRTNLDPFNDYGEAKLYEVLERVGLYTTRGSSSSTNSLKSLAQSRVESLDDSISEGGTNFSVGQRQLLVIARALLHGSMIVIMDEATAAVDAETDAAIQKVMRSEFEKATVITVAHRLNTIMDSDFILVMSDGRASEFDDPKKLLQQGGMFADLVRAASRE